MKSHMRGLVLLISVSAVVLLGGASRSAADLIPTTHQCSAPDPQGRLYCIDIADTDGVSPSGTFNSGKGQATVTAYQYYHVTVSNGGGSTLTNGTLTVNLTDVVPGVTPNAASTAAYIASDSASFCAQTSTIPKTVSCTIGNIAANGSTDFFLVFRTSNTPNVSATLLSGLAAFKEGSNGPNGANPATLPVSANTGLETDHQSSVAWSPVGQTTSLGTDPTFDSQFSTLAYKVPAGHSAFTATMSESNGTQCPAGAKQCVFGELVTVHLPADAGTFSPSNPFHLTITLVPSDFGVSSGSTSSVVVIHQPDVGQPETISARCSSNPPPVTDSLPCIVVTKVTQGQTKLFIIDLYGVTNGGFQTGLS